MLRIHLCWSILSAAMTLLAVHWSLSWMASTSLEFASTLWRLRWRLLDWKDNPLQKAWPMANVRTVGPRPCPVPAPPPPPWQGLPIPPPPPPGVQPAARPVRPVPSWIPTMPPAGLGAQPDACQPEADVGDDGGLQLRLSFSLLFLFRSVLIKKEVDW